MTRVNTALKDLCFRITKGTTPTTMGRPFTEIGVNFIKAEALNGDTSLNRKGFAHVDEETHGLLKRSILQENDVLITIAGANIGKCGYVRPENLPANTNQAVGIVRIDPEKANPRYVYYFFKQNQTFNYIQSLSSQAAQPNINLTMLGNLTLDLPDESEQEAVVKQLLSYDDLIENNSRRIYLLEESARLLYREWFVHLRFPGYEHVEVIDGVPEGWSKGPLGESITLNYGKSLVADNRNEGVFPVFGSSGTVGCHDKALVTGPGIIVGRKGNVGSVFWCGRDYWPIDTVYFISSDQSNLYLYYALQFMQFLSTDVAVPGLNRNFAYSRPFLTPKDNIVDLFTEEVKPIKKQIAVLTNFNKKLSEARDLLLPRMMNGGIMG